MDNEKNIEPTGEEVIADELENEDDISDAGDYEDNDAAGSDGDDAFDSLYDDEDPDSDSEEPDEDPDEDSDEKPEGTVPDERDAQLRAALEKNENIGAIANIILKELGESASGDAEEALIKVAAEATGKSPDEIKRQLASKKAFEAQAAKDIKEIHDAFPEAKKYASVHELPNKVEFAKLIDQGKSVKEAFIATHPDIAARQLSAPRKRNPNLNGTKSHITSSVPKGAKDTSVNISKLEMARLRETFSDKSDAEIRALYKKVSK